MKEIEEVKETKTLALDFDGVCVTNENYPGIGKDIGAIPVLKKILAKGNRIILWTRRDGFALDNAVKWFKDNNIELAGINKMPGKGGGSPKIDADVFIDDKGLGAPLTHSSSGKPYINWTLASAYLRKKGLI